jgi:hypothetical protein
MFRYERAGGAIVKAAPTFKPQVVSWMLRLERMLGGALTRRRWLKRQVDQQLGGYAQVYRDTMAILARPTIVGPAQCAHLAVRS